MELSKTKLSLYSSLGSARFRRKTGLFAVEGHRSVADTLGFFKLEALVASPQWVEANDALARQAGDRLLTATAADFRKLTSLTTPPEVIAIFYLPDELPMPMLAPDRLNLVLDTVQDPGNLGTILRTADWFGIHTVFASRETVDLYNPKCIQACMGSMTRVRVVYCDLEELLSQARGMPVYGLQLDGENIFRNELSETGVIIMGNEGNGISDAVKRYVNSPLLIPPYDAEKHGESLNVAIATAVTLALFRNK